MEMKIKKYAISILKTVLKFFLKVPNSLRRYFIRTVFSSLKIVSNFSLKESINPWLISSLAIQELDIIAWLKKFLGGKYLQSEMWGTLEFTWVMK
jgi:hypothetical protein